MTTDSKPASKAARQREILFDLGARAFGRTFPMVVATALPPGVPMYVCPLCLTAYAAHVLHQKLTIEHVPPKCLGGKPLLLTCIKCNRHSGRELDHHMLKADRPVAVLRGEHEGGQLVDLRIDDGPSVRIRLRRTADGYILEGKDGVDLPSARSEFLETLTQIAAQGRTDWSFNLGFKDDQHLPGRARVGWLRVALLIAFAAFGYRYAFGPALNAVRKQILEPDSEILPPAFHIIDPSSPRAARRLGIVKEPTDLVGVAVQVGWHSVLLPHPTDVQFFERLREISSRPGSTFQGLMQEVEWPKTAMHAADVKPPERSDGSHEERK